MDIQILSAIPSRLRLRISRLNYDSNYAAQIDRELKVLRFITGVRINAPASSITITYDTKIISDTEAKKTILEAIEQLEDTIKRFPTETLRPKDGPHQSGSHLAVDKSTPNNVVFLNFDSKSQNSQTEEQDKKIVAEFDAIPPSEAPTNELNETIQPELVETTTSKAFVEIPQLEKSSSNELNETIQPELVETTTSEASVETPQLEKSSSNELNETIQPELVEITTSEASVETPQLEEPLLDEQVSLNNEDSLSQESVSTSADIDAKKNDALTSKVSHVGETLKLTNQALARRLGISVQALTIRSLQPDFTQWSTSKDPEQIGWVFIKPLNRFYSVSSL